MYSDCYLSFSTQLIKVSINPTIKSTNALINILFVFKSCLVDFFLFFFNVVPPFLEFVPFELLLLYHARVWLSTLFRKYFYFFKNFTPFHNVKRGCLMYVILFCKFSAAFVTNCSISILNDITTKTFDFIFTNIFKISST